MSLSPLFVPRIPAKQERKERVAAAPVLERLRPVEPNRAEAAAPPPPAPTVPSPPPRPVEPRQAVETAVLLGPTNPATTAAAIIRCGKVRRGELFSEKPMTGLAAEIVRQGKIRRGEAIADTPTPPSDPRAKAMTLLNWKRHGTIDAAAERWLSDYFAGVEATRELMR
jgi:hypothetical protein